LAIDSWPYRRFATGIDPGPQAARKIEVEPIARIMRAPSILVRQAPGLELVKQCVELTRARY